jgi:Zn-dependent peptidase ImmA (M78 family)
MTLGSLAASRDKRGLTKAAMQASIKTRTKAGFDLTSPICVFDLCERLSVTVRFTDINMEGMYDRVPKPRIHLSSLRPLPRRAFTCGHELGHHEFGHGSTIDEMKEEIEALKAESHDEFLVNSFSAFTLMPIIGLRGAFARRAVTAGTADSIQMFAVASNFGVGYATLISHLAYGVEEISIGRARELLRDSPKSIRGRLLGDGSPDPLVFVDEMWVARAIDAEVGTTILLPHDARVEGGVVARSGDCEAGTFYKAIRPGIGRAAWGQRDGSAFIRVSRKHYVGLARYRHLEDDDV